MRHYMSRIMVHQTVSRSVTLTFYVIAPAQPHRAELSQTNCMRIRGLPYLASASIRKYIHGRRTETLKKRRLVNAKSQANRPAQHTHKKNGSLHVAPKLEGIPPFLISDSFPESLKSSSFAYSNENLILSHLH